VITQLSSFEGGQWRHGPLSNFYVEPDGTNVEAEYQGFAKTTDRDVQRRIAQMPPAQAKKAGRALDLRADHEEVKIPVMAYFVTKKFRDHDALASYLIATRSQMIVEGNVWHDNIWGNCTCGRRECAEPGLNWLGIILMTVRAGLAATV
jgi:ribA/ribD-fused uncharacterized protein